MALDDYDTEPLGSDGGAIGKHAGLTRKLIAWIKQDMKHVSEWRKEAREDFAFYSNDQWNEDDLNELRRQKRPVITWNRLSPLVNAVVGSEINNRREVRYFAREAGDAKANELLTAAGEWFRDECGAEDEESDAFKSCVITGMGWTDTRLDFDNDPDGAPVIEKMDALEMGWDCNARKPNLTDSRRFWRIREVSYDDAVELTGEKNKAKLHAAWVGGLDHTGGRPHDQDEADLYSGTQDELADGYRSKKCVLVEIRWLEAEPYYRGPDLEQQGATKEYDERQVELIRKQVPDFPVVKQTRKVLKRAFIGREVLGEVDTPMVPAGMFGWECITGYRDEVKSHWYGIVRAAKDPQRWSNKFFSQVMFLLNSQAKGGLIAERGAFEDDRQAETSWAKADIITWAKSGALSGDKPKIMPKSPAQFPAGFFTLFQEAKESITDVTGLSAEFIGTREVDQAGVLEYQRRQSSLNLLAEIFNALRRYRKRQGKVMLYLIQEHLADGRLVRIVGEDLRRYVPLLSAEGIEKAKAEFQQQLDAQMMQVVQQMVGQGMPPEQAMAQAQQMATDEMEKKFAGVLPVDGQYDIIVDDSPTSPNEKDRTWQILMQMLPMVKDMITPEVAIELLAISPLPASMVEKLRGKAQEAAQQPKPPSPEEMKAKLLQQKAEMDAQGKQMDLQVKQAGAEIDQQSDMMDLHFKAQELALEQAKNEQKFASDMRNLAVKEEQNRIAAKRANSQRVSAAKQ